MVFILRWGPGGRINIKMSSYQYRKSHGRDETILRPSYLHNGISHTGKMTSLYWIKDQYPITRKQVKVWVVCIILGLYIVRHRLLCRPLAQVLQQSCTKQMIDDCTGLLRHFHQTHHKRFLFKHFNFIQTLKFHGLQNKNNNISSCHKTSRWYLKPFCGTLQHPLAWLLAAWIYQRWPGATV